MPLLYALRNDIGLNNPHFGCGLAQCGACTVHLDGQPIRSCITPVSAVGNGKIVTLAGLGTPEKPHPLQTAYVEEEVLQCGYCINGWIMTGGRAAARQEETDRRRDQGGAVGPQMPLRHPCRHLARGEARRADDGLREAVMTKMEFAVSRRAILKTGGALVVSIGMPVAFDTVLAIGSAAAQGGRPPLVPNELDSYIAINTDGSVTAYFGKMDMGQGLFTAIGQIVAEELDVAFGRVTVIMGDTDSSVNQGGASGSTGVWLGGKQMRVAAAEARRLLVEMAAGKLGVPVEQISVTDGVAKVTGEPARSVSLCGADRRQIFQRPARLEQTDRQPPLRSRQGETEGSEGPQDRRPIAAARRCRAEGFLHRGFLHRHQAAGHAARPHDPPGCRRRRAREGRRRLDQGNSGREGRLGAGLPGRGRREGVGRHQGRAGPQGRVVGCQAALPQHGRAL